MESEVHLKRWVRVTSRTRSLKSPVWLVSVFMCGKGRGGWRTHAGFCELSGRSAVGFVHCGEVSRW